MTQTATLSDRATSGFHPGRPIQNAIRRLRLWYQRNRTREQLSRLNDHHLRDIGLSEVDRWLECRKWFWQG